MELLSCEFVTNYVRGATPIFSNEIEIFKQQYRASLKETKGINGVVYVFRTEKVVPRLKGYSNIIYIGETKYDAWSRYTVKNDVNAYWPVYSHIVDLYGPIYIDVYMSNDHKVTERRFLSQYHHEYKELPPLNRKG